MTPVGPRSGGEETSPPVGEPPEEPTHLRSGGSPPGVCLPWEAKLAEVGDAEGDADLVRQEWERLETSVYLYLWSWIA